ncbi:MAG: CaiB/BaiF CoA transferase family protein [Acidimicrobiia bacterium]
MSNSDLSPGSAHASGPLVGIRVIDMSSIIAGPGVARHLADMGADVVKVEPPGGDPLRRMGWLAPDGDSYYWKLVGRNKHTVTLNLKDPADLASIQDLIRSADLLIENMRPGKLEELGLAPAELLAQNPALVILRLTAFGQHGPYAHRPGFATLAEAMSGLAGIAGEPDGPPLLPPVALTDEVAAMAGAFAGLAALWHARSTGEGQVVDVNLLRTALQLLGPLPSAYAHLGYEQPRMGSMLPYTVPRGTFECADGLWVAVSASSDSVAGRLLEVLGLGEDERFASFATRVANRGVLDAALAAWIAVRPQHDVLAQLELADVAVAPVYTMSDVLADPHLKATAAFVEVDGTIMQSPIADFDRTPLVVWCAGAVRNQDAGHDVAFSPVDDLEVSPPDGHRSG